MDAITERILFDTSVGNFPQMIESGDKVLILNQVDDSIMATGHMFEINGGSCYDYMVFHIESRNSGERYIEIDGVVFELDQLKPCEIPQELIENEIKKCEDSKKLSERLFEGDDEAIAVSHQNEDFFIKYLVKYIEATYAKKEQPVSATPQMLQVPTVQRKET